MSPPMSQPWTLCVCLAVALLLASPALAQFGEGDSESISASPNPATIADDITITVMGRGACPVFGPITHDEDTIRVELRSTCPFTPPPPDPFTLVATLDPLDPGVYDLLLVLADDTLLASGQLEVLSDDVCVPSATALCLRNNRFRVEVDFRTPGGQVGQGQALELTNDSGLFYFFSPTNIELIVKVLNGCPTPQNSYWFFAGGLTNVEVEIRVTDFTTGEVKPYSNPLRTPFKPIQDTRAFMTCP